jgi:hypothetical protein
VERFAEIGLYFLGGRRQSGYGPTNYRRMTAARLHVTCPGPALGVRRAAAFDIPRGSGQGREPAPWGFVLATARLPGLLEWFVDLWRAFGRPPSDILLENEEEAGAQALWPRPGPGDRLCLDVGHMLAFGQTALLAIPGFF